MSVQSWLTSSTAQTQMWRAINMYRNMQCNLATNTSSIVRTPCGLHIDRSLPKSFDKILIANRGEIACRVMRTARELNVKTVAVFSDADASSMHVQMADEAYRIGPPPAKESYLRGDNIIKVAKAVGAQAIHPGYGFLSENENFARACQEAGVVFIGPPTKAIHDMGLKSVSKRIMSHSGVPVVPGYHEDDQNKTLLREEAKKIGYPIMIKAVAGGGGKGMRIVWKPEDFDESLESCMRESKNSFSDDRVILEKYIQRPRHIEFQVFADKHKNAVHLYERDCSVQRRHQKVFEEAPAPGMTPELRKKMGQSAVDAALAVGYEGAGTVEFIFDAETNDYYFMEMNTRLQVEHCVSEMIVKRDLVQWQLHVAAGHKLPATQEEVNRAVTGHAIEARIYAENPSNNFLPCTGKLVHIRAPNVGREGNIRVETGVRSGDEVSIFYDPMIAKLVVWAPDRIQSLKTLERSLSQFEVVGVPTNIAFLQKALVQPAYINGGVETNFIAQHIKELIPAKEDAAPEAVCVAALALLHKHQQHAIQQATHSHDPHSPWNQQNSFRVNLPSQQHVTLIQLSDKPSTEHEKPHQFKVEVLSTPRAKTGASVNNRYHLQLNGHDYECTFAPSKDGNGQFNVVVGQRAALASVVFNQSEIHVFIDGKKSSFKLPEGAFGSKGSDKGAVSPMAGRIVKVNIKPGDHAKKGSTLIVMEAMKMEHVIRAPRDGIVDKVAYKEGDFAEGGKVLVTFKESESE